MILEEATYEVFGYYTKDLKLQSHKLLIAACDFCGEFRLLKRRNYRTFCHSCSTVLGSTMKGEKNPNFGKYPSEETKALQSAAMKGKHKGKKNPFFGKRHTEKVKKIMRKNHPDQNGNKNHNWQGGRKLTRKKSQAKRKQGLKYILLIPQKDGEVGHHVTNEYVIGIPKEVHQMFSGYARRKHRTLVLQWLKTNDKKKYVKVLYVLPKEKMI